MKKLITIFVGLLILASATVCFAAEYYEMTYEAKNFTEDLKNDQAFISDYDKWVEEVRKVPGCGDFLDDMESKSKSIKDLTKEVKNVETQQKSKGCCGGGKKKKKDKKKK